MNIKILTKYFILFKSLFKLFAYVVIFLLAIVTIFITYKTQVDVWEFFKLGKIDTNITVKYFMIIVSVLIGVATVVQSAPIIRDKLSYWGQRIDNQIIYFLTRQKYFLYEVEDLLSEIRKLINNMNANLQKFMLPLIEIADRKHRNRINGKITELIEIDVRLSIKLYTQITTLLCENDVYDNINKRKKEEANDLLNTSISDITAIIFYAAFIQKVLM